MPELPEVEVVKRSLEKKVSNLTINQVKINDSNLRYKLNKHQLSKLIGKKIIKIQRRSKFLIIFITKSLLMIVHLGMTGKFFFIDKKEKKYKTSFYYNLDYKKDQKHDRVIFFLENKQQLIYNDVRKFGFIKIYNANDYSKISHLENLGPEPLGKKWNKRYFKEFIYGRNRSVKNILMDQSFISGLGNIYVNEILFLCGIRPSRNVNKLQDFEIEKIIKKTKQVLKNAIKLGGSSIKNFSTDDGKKGVFQQHFRVYGRKGEQCSNTDCNNKVMRMIISNRATFFCKRCQK